MRVGIKVKYISNNYFGNLTNGKIYTILGYNSTHFIYLANINIVDDRGIQANYHIYGNNNEPLFEDATIEYRESIINDILE